VLRIDTEFRISVEIISNKSVHRYVILHQNLEICNYLGTNPILEYLIRYTVKSLTDFFFHRADWHIQYMIASHRSHSERSTTVIYIYQLSRVSFVIIDRNDALNLAFYLQRHYRFSMNECGSNEIDHC
jgi:hypothetical protein